MFARYITRRSVLSISKEIKVVPSRLRLPASKQAYRTRSKFVDDDIKTIAAR